MTAIRVAVLTADKPDATGIRHEVTTNTKTPLARRRNAADRLQVDAEQARNESDARWDDP